MFLILNLQFLSSLAHAGVACNSNPTPLPDDVRMISPKLDYIGKTPDGRPAFAHINSNMIYIFEKDFTDKIPKLLSFSSNEFRGDHNRVQYNLASFKSALGISCDEANPSSLTHHLSANPTTNRDNCIKNYVASASGFFKPMAKCCEGTFYNPNTDKCDIPQFVDIYNKSCENNSDCENFKISSPSQEVGVENPSRSTGCFSQSVNDVYNLPGLSPIQDLVLDQSIDWSSGHNLKDVDQACNHARECKSYSCVDRKCQNPTICRLGHEGEQVSASIDCEFGYDPDSSNKCVPGEGYSPYVGLIGEITFTGDPNSQFQFNLPEETMRKAHEGMKQIRAFEWFTLRLSKDVGDCFKLGKYLRETFGQPLLDNRRAILSDYSRTMNQIEKDYETLLSAQENDNSMIQIDGVSLTSHDLATRQSNGYDSLSFMLRKATAQLDYETRMLRLLNDLAGKSEKLAQNIQEWKNNDRSWSFDGISRIEHFHCDAKKRKKDWAWGDWYTSYNERIRYRWETFYLIQDIPQNTKYINENEDFRTNLSLIFQYDVPTTMQNFVAPINLYDPLNYRAEGNLKFDKFGSFWDLNEKPWPWEVVVLNAVFIFLAGPVAWIVVGLTALFSGDVDETRKPREFNGNNNGTLVQFREAVKKDIFEHVKSLKNNSSEKYFIYEPELANWESKNAAELNANGKDCVDDINQDICKKVTAGSEFDNSFNRYMDMLTDYSMAQFFAYSHSTTEGYKNYFTDARSSRVKYFTRMTTDMQNLVLYYQALVEKRQEQIDAIAEARNHVADNFKGEGGVSLDGGNYASNNKGESSGSFKSDKGQMTKIDRNSIKSKLSIEAAKLVFGNNSSSVSDASGGSIFGSANSSGLSEISSAASARTARMKAVNEKAKKKGIDVDKRESERVKVINSRPGTFATASQGSANSNLVSNPKLKSLDAQAQEISKNLNEITSVTSGDSGSGGSGSGGFYGNVVGSQGGSGGKDSTGLSGEEKNHMLDTVDKNASKFNPDEFDSLFDVVSKAYARNLEKILNRKKPGDE